MARSELLRVDYSDGYSSKSTIKFDPLLGGGVKTVCVTAFGTAAVSALHYRPRDNLLPPRSSFSKDKKVIW